MDLRSEVVMEITKNDRVYRFCLPVGAPFGEAFDVAHEVVSKILSMAKDSTEQAKSQIDDKNEKVVADVETNA